jgi:hypothetical protein
MESAAPYFSGLNIWAMLVAIVIRMVVGTLWYNPMLFGKRWMALINMTEEDMEGQGAAMGLAVIPALIEVYVLAVLINYVGATTIAGGLFTGFFVWLGFIATVGYQGVIFEKRPLALFSINTFYELVTLLIIGPVLAIW